MPASRARRLCPEAVFLRARLPDLPSRLGADHGDPARPRRSTIEVVGLDEAYLDLTGLFSPRTAMRRLIAEIEREVGITCSVGIGPNKLVAKVASDAEKPAGFVVLTREEACARFAASPPGPDPGDRPEDGGTAAGDGASHAWPTSPARPSSCSSSASARTSAATWRRRARFEHDGAVVAVAQGRLGVARADLRRRHRRRRRARGGPAPDEPRSSARASPPRPRRAGRSGSRSAWTTGRPSRARTRVPEPTNDPETVAAHALRLLAEYAPARPVRLLGVRVAGPGGRGRTAPRRPPRRKLRMSLTASWRFPSERPRRRGRDRIGT